MPEFMLLLLLWSRSEAGDPGPDPEGRGAGETRHWFW